MNKFLVLMLCFLCLSVEAVHAQSETPHFEIGAQYTALRLSELDVTDSGFGGRFTYNINDNFAVEAEGNFFPQNREFAGGRKVQGLFGVKAGVRGERVGVFAKARPGFVRFSRFYRGATQRPVLDPVPFPLPRIVPILPEHETDFALDLGGLVELYPSRRTLLRFDIGDTIIRAGDNDFVYFPLGFLPNEQFELRRTTSHNLQFSAGFGFRF
jgi:hypothetical protein